MPACGHGGICAAAWLCNAIQAGEGMSCRPLRHLGAPSGLIRSRGAVPQHGSGADVLVPLKELATAVSMKMDLTVLILNDNAYGMIKWKQVPLSALPFVWILFGPDIHSRSEDLWHSC